MSDVTMQELELETAELLPARETLCHAGHSGSSRNTAVIGSGDGHTYQSGLINVSALNGNLDGNFNNVFQ